MTESNKSHTATKHVHNRVKELRKKNHYTQKQLADHIGVTRLTVISIEKGKYEPSIGIVLRLAAVLG
ncbi:helix-turn-helix transcriptional regulator [Gracilibacillus thailandensis]|uniref:Helix-turn-helix domain-containing protein n=1 Tax=Gracilibacillus thailandensis TaxID=563735 RepID=A0A6N7QZC4_9BACI|nr:helix-turn-helix transcriptional regulator [Gracilibacillus thailandensis]MRI66225.1 helix-turn-helix domain-containing protein [Gracilibacillus thailandensis]